MRHAAAAALLLTAGSAAMADVLVVRASGPSASTYPAGKKLGDNAKITLQANDQLVILSGKGTRTFRGPGTFSPTGPSQPAATQVASNSTPQRRARIGAVRSAGLGVPKSPSLWHADVAKSSNICLVDAGNLNLWRADATKPVELTIAGNGATRQVEWPAGQASMRWPSDLPVKEGAAYKLNWAGAEQPTTLTFRMLGGKPEAVEEMATSLIEHGCDQQLDLLIATVPPADGTTTG